MNKEKIRRSLRLPHTFVIIFMITILMAALTWVVPAGEFDRALDPKTGRTMVLAETYHAVPSSPVGLFDTFKAVQLGMIDAADIVFFIFLVFASFYIVMKSGALNGAIGTLLKLTKGKEIWMIPIFMYAFALGGATFGLYEETYAFIPLFVGLAIAIGYDAIVGMCMVSLGVAMGFASAPLNPFTVIIAQTVAELPLYSAMGFRTIFCLVFVTIAVVYTMRYAQKIKKDPSKSLVKDLEFSSLALKKEDLLKTELTIRHKIILVIVGATIVVLLIGVRELGWYINEIAALFLIMGIVSGFVAGFTPSKIAVYFLEGCAEVVYGALIVGLARSILIVMNMGCIADTVIYGLSAPIVSMPSLLGAEAMLLVQSAINFLIPSGSGQAVVSMPIMVPMADLAGINRQIAVLAYQFGDGLSNLLWPTCGIAVMSAIAKVPLGRWWRFFIPLCGILFATQVIFVAIASVISLGPF